jgi:RES domain-containing protein
MANPESPEVIQLFDAIATCIDKAVEFEGVVIRSCSVRFANEHDLLRGDGAAQHGGRWNPRGMKAVYGSLSAVTATRESYQNILKFGFSRSSIRPRVFVGARIRLQRVLDLTDRSIRRRLGFSVTELIEENWREIQNGGEESWTQAIGRGARHAGFEGSLVHSARDRPKGKNLVYFPDCLRTGSQVQILGVEELPQSVTALP